MPCNRSSRHATCWPVSKLRPAWRPPHRRRPPRPPPGRAPRWAGPLPARPRPRRTARRTPARRGRRAASPGRRSGCRLAPADQADRCVRKNLIAELDAAAQLPVPAAEAYLDRIRERFTDLYSERQTITAQLTGLAKDTAHGNDPTLLDELPELAGRLDELPERLQAELSPRSTSRSCGTRPSGKPPSTPPSPTPSPASSPTSLPAPATTAPPQTRSRIRCPPPAATRFRFHRVPE